MIALGTTVRTSTNPTARASADTGGTPVAAGLLVVAAPAGEVATVLRLDDEAGAAGPAPFAPQPALHPAAIRAITSSRTMTHTRPAPSTGQLRIVSSFHRQLEHPIVVHVG